MTAALLDDFVHIRLRGGRDGVHNRSTGTSLSRHQWLAKEKRRPEKKNVFHLVNFCLFNFKCVFFF